MTLTGKIAIVTGAGKGIGRATAVLLAERGAEVVAISRTQADLDGLKADIGGRSIAADLGSAKGAHAAMIEAGRADFLVNCAGLNVPESLLDLTDDGYDRVMDINLRAALICMHHFAKQAVAAKTGGAIVNVTSISGHRGYPNHLAYAASKAGLEGATRVAASELGEHGIRVNAVAPTVTTTRLAKAWLIPENRDRMMERHASGRYAEPEEVASVVAMLLTPDTAMITGAVVPVDGGFLAL
ncbi:SDR family oxidoreductase [Marinovum sp. 2_MG-2023]|uniref:SDR family oxidoreductase n=1 Tax=unclassified Marinovum TaxID=2647166 RepID=UPI0026E34420|nr:MULTISPECIES: SDR family oxidoreductase [unclassified Marinovum]MDO6732171.1 SDR family oxidoreductase [Marinovum sp. 2_MG-2023]MDO6781488.1 SDR family oxidoreductase [Marinovum sp. 1_MG-2023]